MQEIWNPSLVFIGGKKRLVEFANVAPESYLTSFYIVYLINVFQQFRYSNWKTLISFSRKY